jgi:hypothetical protein
MNAFSANAETWTEDNADDWIGRGAHQLTPHTLQQLLDNSIPYIRWSLVSEAACHALADRLTDLAFGEYRDVEPKIDRIGCTVFEYDAVGAEDYFAASKAAVVLRDRLFAQTFDPLRMVLRELSKRTGRRVSIAQDGSGQSYYAGLIRRIELGTELHIDYAPAEQRGWTVCDVRNQLTWNLYVKVGRRGSGRTTVYRRQWQPNDELLRDGSYGFNCSVVTGSDYVTFQPRVGEIVLFNTRNYHIVDPSLGERMTVGSAIGETRTGGLVLWS